MDADPDNRPTAKPWVPHKPEQRLSMAVQRLLNRTLLPPCYFTALHDADGVARSEHARARDKVRGVRSGQLDWDIVQGQPLLCRKLELKRGANGLSENQRQTVGALTACGAEPVVAWTLAEVYAGLTAAGFRFAANAPYVLAQVQQSLEAWDREAALVKQGVLVKPRKQSPKTTEPRYAWGKKAVQRARRGGIPI